MNVPSVAMALMMMRNRHHEAIVSLTAKENFTALKGMHALIDLRKLVNRYMDLLPKLEFNKLGV